MSTSTINLQAEKMALKDTISKEEILAGIRRGLMEIKEAKEKGIQLMDAKQLLDEL